MRSAALVSVLVLAGCGGATNAGTTMPADAPPRECTAALRFSEPGFSGAGPSGAGSSGAGSLEMGTSEPAEASAETETPRTEIRLVLICEDEETRSIAVSTEVGACFSEAPSEGALLGARCWWAGQGAIVVVRRNGDVLEALRADVDELTGAEALERVGELAIPESHSLRAL